MTESSYSIQQRQKSWTTNDLITAGDLNRILNNITTLYNGINAITGSVQQSSGAITDANMAANTANDTANTANATANTAKAIAEEARAIAADAKEDVEDTEEIARNMSTTVANISTSYSTILNNSSTAVANANEAISIANGFSRDISDVKTRVTNIENDYVTSSGIPTNISHFVNDRNYYYPGNAGEIINGLEQAGYIDDNLVDDHLSKNLIFSKTVYDAVANVVKYTDQTQDTSVDNNKKRQVLKNIGLFDDLVTDDLGGSITGDMKSNARKNIGAAATGDIPSGVVLYTDQTNDESIDDTMRAQARANIGAISQELVQIPEEIVLYTDQTNDSSITDEDRVQVLKNIGLFKDLVTEDPNEENITNKMKSNARKNIGAAAIGDIPSGVVLYTDQTNDSTITDEMREQARANIGAAAENAIPQGVVLLNNIDYINLKNTVASINAGGVVTDVELSNDNKSIIVSYSDEASNSINIAGSLIASVTYDNSTGLLHFLNSSNMDLYNGPFIIQGGGGGITRYSVRIINNMNGTNLTVASSQSVILSFKYIEYYGSDIENSVGYLTLQYKNSTDNIWNDYLINKPINSNATENINITNLLLEGNTTNVRIICSNGRSNLDASSKTLEYEINSVNISITSSFNSSATYTGNFIIPYSCIGRRLNKTVYLYIDDELYTHVNIGTSNNQNLQMSVVMGDNYNYGSHSAKMWFETEDGARSNVLSFIILYNNGTSSNPIIGAYLEKEEIENGETLRLNYVCYTPNQEVTDTLSIRVYSIIDNNEVNYYNSTFSNIRNNITFLLPIMKYPLSGKGYIELISGATNKLIEFNIKELQSAYDLNSITTGLIYNYKPTGYTNNMDNKDIYTYTITDAVNNERNIYTRMTGFNWVTDGYLYNTNSLEADEGEFILLSGEAKMNIDLPILSSSFINADNLTVVLDATDESTVITNGRTIEFEFKLENVTNQNSIVFSCLNNDGVGFVITPQVCYLLSDGQNAILDSTGFIENEELIPCAYIKDEKHIRITFVIQSASHNTSDGRFASYANIFINGEYANSFLYPNSAIYDSNAIITIGSSDCVTKIYDIKMYNRELSNKEVLQNYMNSTIDIRQRISKNEYNDILDSSGSNVDYIKARKKYPCLLFIGLLSKYKGDKQKVGVVLTKPDGHGGYTTEFSLLDRNVNNTNFVSLINVQGTSSQRFMRKNYKVKLVKNNPDYNPDAALPGDPTKKVKYVLKGYDEENNPLSIGESTLCFKMDYMSTDHANTFNANIADTLFNDKDPNSLIQNTVWGFRCLLFNMEEADYSPGTDFANYSEGKIMFAGDGCLNNDKSNSKTFGLETKEDSGNVTKQQKWEFKDNSQPLCSFKTDCLMKKVYATDGSNTYKRAARNGLESCYPDEGDLDDAGIEPRYDYIQILYTWVYQRANFWDASTDNNTGGSYNGVFYETERKLKKAIFKNEFTLHFNLLHALVYYLFIEWVALCDNRAKNMFLSTKDTTAEHIVFTDEQINSIWDTRIINDETGAVDVNKIDWNNSTFCIWYTDLYDLDSCFGAENSGYIRIPYYADWNYVLPRIGTHQFNGYDSRLWCMFEEAFADEIKLRAKEITRSNTGYGALNYDVLKDVHITNNAELVCPAVVNNDMIYKYEDAWTQGYWDYSESTDHPTWTQTNLYKYLQRGSRTEQKESFIYRRSMMLYSKYQCDQFINNQLNFRCGKSILQENTGITLSPIQTMWMGITYGDSGSVQMSTKKAAMEKATILSPNDLGRSDNVHIHGATNLVSISSLAAFYPYEIGLTNAKRLKTLLIGSDAIGYSNGNLSNLDTSSCTLLDTLNIQNCIGFGESPINLTKNTLIREIYAGGSNVPYFEFANGGILLTFELGSPRRIIVKNQPYMRNFTVDNLENLVMLHILNTPNMNVLEILNETIDQLRLGIRLINIDEVWNEDDFSIFDKLISVAAKGKRLNANGNLDNNKEAYPVITGRIHCKKIGQHTYDLINRIYKDDLTIIATEYVSQYIVHFYDYEGKPTKDKNGNDYIQYVAKGGVPYDPYAAGEINEPTKPDTQECTYSFDKESPWKGITEIVGSEKNIFANYKETTRKYTVIWYKYEGGPILKDLYEVPYGSEVTYNDNPTIFPSYTDGLENLHLYRVFTGWDKSTGYITGDTNVYAQWDEINLADLTSKELNVMTPAEIYAIAKTGRASDYWTPKDYIDISVGRDFDFNPKPGKLPAPGNVISEVLAENLFLDGNTMIIPKESTGGIQLFAPGAPNFTLAIEYEILSTGTNGEVLVSCGDTSGDHGFKFFPNSGTPTIRWKNDLPIGANYQRGILVLRHNKSEKEGINKHLYAYSDNTTSGSYEDKIVLKLILCTEYTPNTYKLCFGAAYKNQANKCKGWIHWCKIWYDDLGDKNARQLANWTHESWRMNYIGPKLYEIFTPEDEDNYKENPDEFDENRSVTYCSASFIATNALYLPKSLNITAINKGGWRDCNLRSFMNSRCFEALPYCWQAIIKPVRIKSSRGQQLGEIFHASDRIYIPSYKEIISSVNNPYSAESLFTVPWYNLTSSASDSNMTYTVKNAIARLKPKNILIPEDVQRFNDNTNPAGQSQYTVKEGDLWYTSSYYHIFVSKKTLDKHNFYEGQNVSTGSNIIKTAPEKGYWFRLGTFNTRSPDSGSATAWVGIRAYSNTGSVLISGSGNYGNVVCFSI